MSLRPPPNEEFGVKFPKSGVRCTYKKGLRRITLARYLASRIVFEPEEVGYDEVLVFYDNLIWCLDKSLKDPAFRSKFSNSLEEITSSVTKVRFSEDIEGSIRRLSIALKPIDSFYLPKRNYKSVARYFVGHFHVLPTVAPGIPKERIPPKPYIGKGYNDKGARKDPAFDGTPSWQEVASFYAQRDENVQTNDSIETSGGFESRIRKRG